MRHPHRLVTFGTLLATLLAAALVLAHHGPTSIVIEEAAKKQPAVTFPHQAHWKVVPKCETCHHTSPGLTADTDKDVKKCATCHLDPEKATTPSMREMSLKKNPFHVLCIDCHKAEKKGPTKCAECHVKK